MTIKLGREHGVFAIVHSAATGDGDREFLQLIHPRTLKDVLPTRHWIAPGRDTVYLLQWPYDGGYVPHGKICPGVGVASQGEIPNWEDIDGATGDYASKPKQADWLVERLREKYERDHTYWHDDFVQYTPDNTRSFIAVLSNADDKSSDARRWFAPVMGWAIVRQRSWNSVTDERKRYDELEVQPVVLWGQELSTVRDLSYSYRANLILGHIKPCTPGEWLRYFDDWGDG